ncbi:MAG: hypothetical protein MUF01_03510 [Bryobacterales bacterium]|jgi:hypothetical protein|nr:hypothetical protein [Bryobacterales bacterium]
MNKTFGVMAATALLLVSCGKNTSSAPPPEGGATPAPVAASAAQAGGATAGAMTEAGGLQWQAPDGWSAQPERPMRAATYSVPAEAGDPEPGEIAVFYFGPNEGGGVQANIDRWIGQVRQPDGSDSTKKAKVEKVQGAVALTMLDLTGTYLASSGPMMQVSAEKPGFRMIGAIAEGPQGAVFFKFTGPEKTVQANAAKYLEMVKSVRRK